jgi:glycyl-tRNA synthetase
MPTLEEIISLAKRRGFVFQTSDIYGGLANSYDYGPLGVELLRNIRNLWWKTFIIQKRDMVGVDSQIILHPETWVASGHVGSFSDPLVEDTVTQKRYRADHLIESWLEKHPQKKPIIIEELSVAQLGEYIIENEILSPDGNSVTPPKAFNLLFETAIGSVAGEKATVYLRGETAQGIFTNFKNVIQSTRQKLPFGVGQLGKSFRNEITTGQFVFRTLEFEQAEIEYFFDPEKTEWQPVFESWKTQMWQFVTKKLGVRENNLRWRKHTDTERSHYSKETYDLDYNFPFGWKELWGVAYRTDFDLKQHQEHSNQSLTQRDPETNREFIPHVIEPALGVNRAFLMLLSDAYWNDTEKSRIVLRLKPTLAPYIAAVSPLLKNKPELVAEADKIFSELQKKFSVTWDDRGNIGKRYLAQDEIGTPFCITIDFETLETNTVTIRYRDSAAQERVAVDKLSEILENALSNDE